MSFALSVATLTFASTASADQTTKVACVHANEEGQDLRREGKLIEARDRFISCATPSCPNVLRQDCILRRDEAQRAIPALHFIVTDSGGGALPNASITVDGADATRRPDDAIEMNPGQHTIEISLPGHDRAVRRLALQEGDGRRDETIVLRATETPPVVSSLTPQRALAYGSAGVGLALVGIGTYFGFAAKSTYDDASSPANCPRGPTSCNDAALEGAKRADNQAAVSTAMFIVGGLLVAGGVVLYFTAPKDRAVSLSPAVGPSVAGLEARTAF